MAGFSFMNTRNTFTRTNIRPTLEIVCLDGTPEAVAESAFNETSVEVAQSASSTKVFEVAQSASSTTVARRTTRETRRSFAQILFGISSETKQEKTFFFFLLFFVFFVLFFAIFVSSP